MYEFTLEVNKVSVTGNRNTEVETYEVTLRSDTSWSARRKAQAIFEIERDSNYKFVTRVISVREVYESV